MQTVDVGVVTEDYTAALDAASRMPANPGLPLAARCRHLADRACAHVNLGQEEQALALLLTAEGMSPEWMRHQTLVRAVVRDLLTAERRRSTPLRDLAKRVGVNRWDTVNYQSQAGAVDVPTVINPRLPSTLAKPSRVLAITDARTGADHLVTDEAIAAAGRRVDARLVASGARCQG